MKKTFLFVSAAVMGLSILSCNKQGASPVEVPAGSPETGNIVVSISPEKTKATSNRAGEVTVRSLQVFVFDEEGLLETDKFDDTGAQTLTLTTLTGDKHIWALVNAPRQFLPKDTRESSFSKTVTYLSDNQFSSNESQSGLVMVGAYGATQVPGAQNGALNPDTKNIPAYVVGSNSFEDVPINVYRLGARISLEKVSVKFNGTSLENASSFRIADIYLKNVVNALYIDGTDNGTATDASLWTNRITEHATATIPAGNFYTDSGSSARHSNLSYLLCDKNLSLSTANVNGGEISVNKDWYVYPNGNTEDNTGSTWCARHTRLVIHAVVSLSGGAQQDTYYVFPIPPTSIAATSAGKILSNHTYDISNITITMLGKDHDDDDTLTETGKAKVTITISGWTDNYTVTYEI